MRSSTVEGYPYEEFIYCCCGCQKTRPKYDWKGDLAKYVLGHNNRGRRYKHKEETKLKLRQTHESKNKNPSYGALHKRIRKILPKPKDGKCMLCLKNKFRTAACITAIYNMEFRNWAWFCESCHKKWDNIGRRRTLKKKKLLV